MTHIVVSQLQQLRANTHLGDLLDILVISVIFYYVLFWFRRRASRSLIIILSIIASLYALTQMLNMYLTSLLFHAGLAATLVVLVIIFQSDIRRAFELMEGWRFWGGARSGTLRDPTLVDTLVSTVADFAQNRVGALIVLQGREALDRHVRGGTSVNGEPSYPLLYSIFDHNSPGHDGAVLIDQGKINRLGVLLPLSNNLRAVSGRGTRHTAALGLSEQSDAMALVVSEERGTISIAHQGKLRQVDSLAVLKRRIEGFYSSSSATEKTPLGRRWIREHIGLKALSVTLACLLWLLFAYRVETVYRTFEVPIEYRNLSSRLIIAEGLPTRATLTISGPERDFTLNTTIPPVSIDMSTVKEGDNEIPVTAEHVTIPSGLELIRVEPGLLQFEASLRATVRLPVKVTRSGEVPEGFQVTDIKVRPESVTVKLDSSAWGKVTSIPTEPLLLEDLEKDAVRTLRLELPNGAVLEDSTRSTVRVRASVEITKEKSSQKQPASP
ncbi:MAG: hypothetical protein GF344_14715 [Chitinivibrionales bacterium]|nr:hypothetical protein [Chitinivibrionales bacterium]MBD3357967.1 hypothetical protein [Chitinivibrionales bacterium]